MGRYYRGDIQGKFWFGVQSSTVPRDFSPDGEHDDEDGNYTYWGFSKDTLPNVEKHLGTLTERLGEYKEKLDAFFKDRDMYNDEELVEAVAPRRCKGLARSHQHLVVHIRHVCGHLGPPVRLEVVANVLEAGKEGLVAAVPVRNAAPRLELGVAPVVDPPLRCEDALELALLLCRRQQADLVRSDVAGHWDLAPEPLGLLALRRGRRRDGNEADDRHDLGTGDTRSRAAAARVVDQEHKGATP